MTGATPPRSPLLAEMAARARAVSARAARMRDPLGRARTSHVALEVDLHGWIHQVEIHLAVDRCSPADLTAQFDEALTRARARAAVVHLTAAGVDDVPTELTDAAEGEDAGAGESRLWVTLTDSPSPPSMINIPDLDALFGDLGRKPSNSPEQVRRDWASTRTPKVELPTQLEPLLQEPTTGIEDPFVVTADRVQLESVSVIGPVSGLTAVDIATRVITAQSVALTHLHAAATSEGPS